MSSARRSIRSIDPPIGSTSTRARNPPTMAPREAPDPIRPNSRFACRVSNNELA
jgi:hypothetical protein